MILMEFFFNEHTATLFLGKVNEYAIIISYRENVIYFFIEWAFFGPKGMPNRVEECLREILVEDCSVAMRGGVTGRGKSI